MTSPDYAQFIDLSLYDKSATDILTAAQVTLQSRIPDWVPSNTNIEVMLMEAMALEVSETVFSVNRLPITMLRALLALYEVDQNPGTPPSVELTFTAYDTDGYTIPAGTEVILTLDNDEYISFFTDAVATIVATTTTIAVTATSTAYTDVANGVVSGTSCLLVNSLIGIDFVETSSVVSGGTIPETVDAWTLRGTQRLQRLVDTLVIPEHFTSAALEDANVFRANTINNYDPAVGPAPGDNPGHVTVVVYGDNAEVSDPNKTALQASLAARANANLNIHVIDPTLTTQAVTATIVVEAGYVAADVIADVEAALTAYLNTNTWPWEGTIRRFELVTVIDAVAGVSYVDTLTVPAADVTLADGATLASVGVLTITEA